MIWQETFKSVVDTWLHSVRSHTEGDVVLTVVGNKLDNAPDHREVETLEAQKFATDIDAELFETSAKTGENVDKLFNGVGKL